MVIYTAGGVVNMKKIIIILLFSVVLIACDDDGECELEDKYIGAYSCGDPKGKPQIPTGAVTVCEPIYYCKTVPTGT